MNQAERFSYYQERNIVDKENKKIDVINHNE